MKRSLFLALLLFTSLSAGLFAQDAATPAPAPPAAGQAQPLKALLVCGGCCHDYEHQKVILSEGISARANVQWTIVHEGIPSGKDDARKTRVSIYEKPEWWKGYDVVLHNECFGFVEDAAFVEGITAAHKAGVPALFLHCSSHSYRMAKGTEEWHKAVGISSHEHEKKQDILVKVLKQEHPIMKSFPAEWLDKADELYKNDKVWETATPLAQGIGATTKNDHVVIWVNEYHRTRVFATTLGHANDTVSSQEYLGLVTRGLLWACGKLDENGLPMAGYGPATK